MMQIKSKSVTNLYRRESSGPEHRVANSKSHRRTNVHSVSIPTMYVKNIDEKPRTSSSFFRVSSSKKQRLGASNEKPMVSSGSDRRRNNCVSNSEATKTASTFSLHDNKYISRNKVLPLGPSADKQSFSPFTLYVRNDSMSVASDITEGYEFGMDAEDYEASAVFETLPPTSNCVPNSWTIRVLNANHNAGDTLWFRLFFNGEKRFWDLEDREILRFVEAVLQTHPEYSFYMKTSDENEQDLKFFEANLIIDVLRLLLARAKTADALIIPSSLYINPTEERKAEAEAKENRHHKRINPFRWLFSRPSFMKEMKGHWELTEI